MSRTHKDTKWEYRNPEYDFSYGRIGYEYTAYLWVTNNDTLKSELSTTETHTRIWYGKQAGCRTKKRKEVDTEWHWMTTPGWWIRLMMTRPQRRKHHMWEDKIKQYNQLHCDQLLDMLDQEDWPTCNRKPYIYYW